jgi:hypothetical protein
MEKKRHGGKGLDQKESLEERSASQRKRIRRNIRTEEIREALLFLKNMEERERNAIRKACALIEKRGSN